MLLASLIGLVGVLLVAKPSGALLQGQALVGLAASILAAFAFVSIREMSDTEPAFRMVFYFALFSTLLSAIPMTWAWQPLQAQQLWLLLGVGLLATVSQIIMSKAYSLAPPGRIGPFAYLAIVFAGLIAWWRWGETPDSSSLLGAALIFTASLLSLWRAAPPAKLATSSFRYNARPFRRPTAENDPCSFPRSPPFPRRWPLCRQNCSVAPDLQ